MLRVLLCCMALVLVIITTVNAQKLEYVTIVSEHLITTYDNGAPALTTASGHVNVALTDGTITADNAIYNHKTYDLELNGNVTYVSPKQTVHGDRMQISARTKIWTLDGFDVILQPLIAPDQILLPIFLKGTLIDRSQSGTIVAVESDLTTCDLPHPHYDFSSRKTTIKLGDSIKLEHTSIYFKGRKLYTIPRLVIPLTDENDLRITPVVGQSDEEGYYVKTAYNYPVKDSQTGMILLDLMSKKGVGKGIDHSYRYKTSSGKVRLYHIFDKSINQDTFDGSISHSGNLGEFKMNASADFRSNSYLYASTSKTFTERLAISKMASSYNTSLSISRSVNETLSRTTRLSGSLEHSQTLNERASVTGNFDYSGYRTGSYNESKLTSDIGLNYNLPEMDMSLSTTRFSDFSETSSSLSGFYGTEKLPELSITSDNKRLGIPGRNTQLLFAYGKYLELPSVTPVDRAFFSLKLRNSMKPIGAGWTISDSGGFEQYLYSDNTAQYSLDHMLQVERKLGTKSTFSITHRIQRPAGYTPLRLDYTGRYNSLYASLNMKDSSVHTVSFSSGFDFEDTSSGWQDIIMRSKYAPSKKFSFYTSTGFDLNRSQWRTVVNQLNVRPSDEYSLGVGSRYDTVNQRWALLRTVVDAKVDVLTRLQMIQSYNGATKEFDYSAVRVTRDLHCWEASLTYTQQKGFINTTGIMLNFRLKALPFYPAFGSGQYGQALDTGIGEMY